MDDTTTLLIGFGVGVGVGMGLALLWQSRQATATATGQPSLTSHNVIRDDEGRIKAVETVNGVGGGAAGVQQPPAVRPDAVE